MPKIAKVAGSIRTDGRASIGVSRKTRDRINVLAQKEGIAVSDYIKKLAEKADEKQPVSAAAKASIIEQLVDENERMSIKMRVVEAEMDLLKERYAEDYSKIELALGRIFKKITGRDPGIRAAIAKKKQGEAVNNG